MDSYCTADEANLDKAQLVELLDALNAWFSALRRNDDGLWVLRGRPGCYVSTWGDGVSWQLVMAPDELMSKQAWTWIKKRLAFCEVTQDGDQARPRKSGISSEFENGWS